jgi:hypothetical protein
MRMAGTAEAAQDWLRKPSHRVGIVLALVASHRTSKIIKHRKKNQGSVAKRTSLHIRSKGQRISQVKYYQNQRPQQKTCRLPFPDHANLYRKSIALYIS